MEADKTLIVILNDYPYNNGEPFFENEISFLSSSFKHIFVYSVMGRPNEAQTRTYPENVKCVPLSCGHNRLKYCFKGLFSVHKDFSIRNRNIIKFLMNSYIFGRNNEIFHKIRKHILKENINLENCVVYSYWLTLGISAFKLKQHINNNLGYSPFTVSRCHRYDLYSYVNKYNYQPLQKEVIELLDCVCSCSESGNEYLKKMYPNQAKKIITSKLGTRFHTINTLQNDNKQKVFVSCSGLRPVKRLDLFADGFALAASQDKSIHWTCIGGGEEKDKIAYIINQNSMNDRVSFLGDLSNDDVYKYYEGTNVFCFVNTSLSEGIPVSIMEAISFGIPVIATDVGGTSEIVNSSNGILLSKDCTKEDVCAAILKLCGLNDDDYYKLRLNSRNKWEREYNANLNYNKWVNTLLKGKI